VILRGDAAIDLTGRRGTIVIERARGVKNGATGGVDVSLFEGIGGGEIGGENGSEGGKIVEVAVDGLGTVGLLRESGVKKSNEENKD